MSWIIYLVNVYHGATDATFLSLSFLYLKNCNNLFCLKIVAEIRWTGQMKRKLQVARCCINLDFFVSHGSYGSGLRGMEIWHKAFSTRLLWIILIAMWFLPAPRLRSTSTRNYYYRSTALYLNIKWKFHLLPGKNFPSGLSLSPFIISWLQIEVILLDLSMAAALLIITYNNSIA